jgi:hypothetical protein
LAEEEFGAHPSTNARSSASKLNKNSVRDTIAPATTEGQGQPASSGHSPETTLDKAITRYLPLLGAIGVALYGILRLAYLFFYLQLRTTPEEVGYGYTQVLSQSVVGALELTLLLSVLLAVFPLGAYGGQVLIGRVKGRSSRSSTRAASHASSRHFHMIRRILMRCLVVAFALVLLTLPGLAWWQGGLARSGQTVRNVYFIGIPYLPVLAVQAVPARVLWVDSGSNRQFDLSKRDCLMYLGQTNGTTVLYDVQTHESIRLPTSDITVSLRYAFFVPSTCR